MGALGRTDFDCGEVEPSDGVGGDGGGDGGLLPVPVGGADEQGGEEEADRHHQAPHHLAHFGLVRGDVGDAVDGGGLQELPQDLHRSPDQLSTLQV